MSTTSPPRDTPPPERLRDEAQDWLLRLTSGQATLSDARAFRQWCGQGPHYVQAFKQVRELWLALAEAQQLQVKPLVQAQNKPLGRAIRPSQFTRRAFLAGTAAASVAVLVLPRFMPGAGLGSEADFVTAVGEQQQVALANDVMLDLNTDTQVKQLQFDDGSMGIALLQGEVAVQVPGTLRIVAGPGELIIAAAQVNLRVEKKTVCVTCLAGSLKVWLHKQDVLLGHDQQLRYSQQGLETPVRVERGEVLAWREQMLVFNDEPLTNVIDEINRYRPGMILLINKKLGQRRVQARFTLQQLSGVAALIREAYGARVTELPGGVLLVS